ncbi:hypothetical protein Tco_1060409 [Tanacetum coccineum]
MKDELSASATKLGTSLMLDTYTTSMFMESWGWCSFAKAIIDLRADVELKDILVVPVPNIEGGGYILHSRRVESNTGNDGKNQAGGKYGSNTKSKLMYMHVITKYGLKLAITVDHIDNMATTSFANKKSYVDNGTKIMTPNLFEALNKADNDVVNMDDEDGDYDVIKDDNETARFMNLKYPKNMSTSPDNLYDDDNYDDYECDNLTPELSKEYEYLFCDALDIRIPG